jgi:hypothetical protein
MTYVKITFERGGVFVARLLESEAPKTCAAFKKWLPAKCRFHHSIVSGQAIVGFPDHLTVELENARTVGIYPGTLCFLPRCPPLNVPDEIYITYGPYFVSRCSTIDFQQPVNVFGIIEEGLTELERVGRRILEHGAEEVAFSLL